jgi:uncharacterized protein with PIN domain
VAILGIGMFALPAGLLGAAFMEEIDQRKRKPSRCPHCGKPLANADATALSHLPAESSAEH